ncbi:Conserved hypothetical protein [gamma proteobacterium HdN1]|nr:Conserved hypothetical protein [gamma proteobacterium HdN1]
MPRFLPAVIWLLITCALGIFSYQQWHQGLRLDANLFSLLPTKDQDPAIQKAQQTAEAALAHTTLLWVSPSRKETLPELVNNLHKKLNASGLFLEIYSETPIPSAQQLSALLPWRFALLSPEIRASLSTLQTDASSKSSTDSQHTLEFVQAYLARITSPISSGPIPLQQDLFGLTNAWLKALPLQAPNFNPETRLWQANIAGREGAFLILINKTDAFTLEAPKQIADLIQEIRLHQEALGGKVLATGAALFAAAAAQQAEQEISTVGLGSMIAALGLLLLVFRSPRALLCLVPVAYGSWVALLGCGLVFERVHLMTLIFGASLTGVSIDYAVHLMADAFKSQGQWSARSALQKLAPGLTLSMLTSVLAYALLGLAPFPGLQQIAVFSALSLLSAYTMVVMVFPVLLHGFQRKHDPILLKLIRRSLQLRQYFLPQRMTIILVVIGIALAGITQIQSNDSIRDLYGTDAQLSIEDQLLRNAFGIRQNSEFILVEAIDEQALLKREQQLAPILESFIERQRLASYAALSQWILDASTQKKNLALLEDSIFSPTTQLKDLLIQQGLNPATVEKEWQSFHNAQKNLLDINTALSLPVAAPWRTLWLGSTPKGVASRIALQGATDIPALREALAAIEGVRLVDPVSDISQLLGDYRRYTSVLIGVALIAIWGFLSIRYGMRDALQVVIAPTLAVLLTIGIHGWLGLTFNIFSLFGFLVVLGMGVDYAIYFYEADDHLENTALGIALDVLTTLFSFGLLCVSTTPAVSAFGASVLLGIVFCWLFAWLWVGLKPSDQADQAIPLQNQSLTTETAAKIGVAP